MTNKGYKPLLTYIHPISNTPIIDINNGIATITKRYITQVEERVDDMVVERISGVASQVGFDVIAIDKEVLIEMFNLYKEKHEAKDDE